MCFVTSQYGKGGVIISAKLSDILQLPSFERREKIVYPQQLQMI